MSSDTITAPPGAGQLSLESAGQADSLDQLEGIARATIDAPPQGAAPGAPGAPVAQIVSNASLIADTLKTAIKGFSVITDLRSPQAVVDDKACRELGDLWGAWCDRRQINLNAQMKGHADTFTAAIATAMLGLSLVQAVRAELAERRPVEVKTDAEKTSKTAPPPAPAPAPASSDTATFVGGTA